ncbi:MAG: GyrI-like domain-containing protein [Sphingomonadales bacterium]
MRVRIENINEKKLVGKRMMMSYADYRIAALWSSFMPIRKEITNNLNNDLVALTIYSSTHFTNFSPTNTFEKWAAVEVANFDQVSPDMETTTLPGGLYAVFLYKGSATGIAEFYQNIFTKWLPNAGFDIDQRPHLEIMGEKYKNNDPLSEEEIWIPIKAK